MLRSMKDYTEVALTTVYPELVNTPTPVLLGKPTGYDVPVPFKTKDKIEFRVAFTLVLRFSWSFVRLGTMFDNPIQFSSPLIKLFTLFFNMHSLYLNWRLKACSEAATATANKTIPARIDTIVRMVRHIILFLLVCSLANYSTLSLIEAKGFSSEPAVLGLDPYSCLLVPYKLNLFCSLLFECE